MKRLFFGSLLVTVFVSLVGPSVSLAQQDGDSAETVPAESEASAADEADENNRLPPGYSEIITNSQRRRIYEIQKSYQKQIDDLIKQIQSIESKRNKEVESILDDQQKQILKFILQIRERNRKEEASARTETATQ